MKSHRLRNCAKFHSFAVRRFYRKRDKIFLVIVSVIFFRVPGESYGHRASIATRHLRSGDMEGHIPRTQHGRLVDYSISL